MSSEKQHDVSASEESKQLSVDLVGMRGGEPVRCSWVVDLLGTLDELGRLPGRVLDRDDLVIFTVQHERRHVEFLEVRGEIGLGECLDALISVLRSGLHAPEPELVEDALGDFGARPVGSIECYSKILVVLRAVTRDASSDLIEHLHGQTLGICLALQHDWRHGCDKYRFLHAIGSVPTDVSSNFAASCGVTDKRCLLEIKRLNNGGEIVRITIHVVMRRCLARAAVSATIDAYATIPVLGKKYHLPVPSVGVQRPTVGER